MKKKFTIITLLAVLSLFSIQGWSTRPGKVFETEDYWLKISPYPVTVGEAVRFLFYGPKAVKIQGQAVGQQLHFYRYGNYSRALLGIYPKTAAQTYSFNLEIIDKQGRSTILPVSLKVVGKKFAQTRITLPPQKKELTSEKKLAPERKKLKDIIKTETPKLYWRELFIRPTRGRISQRYGTKNIINGELNYHHNGIDYANGAGTKVAAANDGKVILAETLDVRGKTIVIDHGQGVLSAYFHLQDIIVKRGHVVRKGWLIGRMGQSGMATGPHLHWTTYIHGVPINPINFLQGNLL